MTRRVRTIITAAIPVAVFMIDRLTKNYFATTAVTTSTAIIRVTQHQNYGLIANLPVPSWIIIAFTTAVLAAIIWKIVRDLYALRPTSYALALVAGGALGNLFDRVTMGYVFDWILLFNRSVINIADIAIGGGILWWIVASRARLSTS